MANTSTKTTKQAVKVEPTEKKVEVVYKTNFDAYTGNEPYLFVSYSHRDSKHVYKVLDILHEKKFRIWYDESCENGNDFRDELRQRIKNSSGILLFVSKSSMGSAYCGMEIIVAREYGKRLYPIYLDDDSSVPPAFTFLLQNTHHSNIKDMDKLISSMVRDLPPESMDRLTISDGVLTKCEDNGDYIEVGKDEKGNDVRKIEAEAFKERKALKNILLPDTLEEIGAEAFRGCSNLKEMHVPVRTAKIGESAFRDCVKMRKLVVDNDCIKIGERAFENCAELKDVQLPDGLTELYGGIFNSCKALETIKLPSKLTIIGENAFSDCVGLTNIEIPSTVTKIDDLVFNGCVSLSKIELPEGVKKIGKSAFKNCRSLTTIEIPVSVVSIADAPFKGCEKLKSIKVAPKNMQYKSVPNAPEGNDHVLFNKNKSILITYPANSRQVQYNIPDSVTVISDWAFCDCKLTRITMPDSVAEIGEGAFCNCLSLDEIEIPDSVTKIDDCAFRGCTRLDKVIIPSSVTDLGWGLFDGCEEKVVVYCDEGSEAQDYCIRNGIKEARIEEFYK